jgi:hypothetical protein
MKHKIAALAATASLLACLVPSAFAAEISRDEYKSAVEPICKANTKAIQKTLKGVEAGVKRNKLKAQSGKLAKAGRQMKQTYNKLKAQPQPTADEAKLRKWLGYIKQEADLFTKLSKLAKKEKKGPFSSTRSKMDTIANKANVEVLSFSFKDCKVDPSSLT